MRWVGTIMAGTLVAGLLAIGALWAGSEAVLGKTYPLRPERAQAGPAASAPEGRRLAKLYGCTSCHGADFRGHLYNPDPQLVRHYAPNLTLTAARWSDAQLAQAIRQGVRPTDGRALWGMPSATFTQITDAEMSAVLAYLRASPAGGRPTPADRPGIRARIAMLRGARSAPELVAAALRRPPRDLGPAHARGRHIAQTVCSECHGSDLAGDAVEGGPDLRIAGAYDLAAFTHLMRTGKPIGGRDLGIMSETAREDLRVFTDDEIAALHGYLRARAEAKAETAE